MAADRQPRLRARLHAIDAPRTKKPILRLEPDRALRLLIKEMLWARYRAGLTQEQIAKRLNTTRSAISRLESGKFNRPTLATLEHYALVTGCRLEIRFRKIYNLPPDDQG